MKRPILFIITAMILLFGCKTQTEPQIEVKEPTFEEKMQENTKELPTYKMIATENIHILLKWNTRTGDVWMTQYALSGTDGLEHKIPSVISIESENSWNGRFELYPTKNMFNFIMVDTYYGTTYQVQWNTKDDNCFVVPILDSQYYLK